MVVVVVVDIDGDGDVEVDATLVRDRVRAPCGHADRVRNIAERAGRWSDSANRYKIGRGEAMECAASLDMKLRKLSRYQRGGQLLEGIVAMLTKII